MAKTSFNVVICGAGLAGLGAAIALARKGHRVTVLEAAQQLNEVGAGIQIPPNSSRILTSYGLAADFEKNIVWPSNLQFRRYETGDVIGITPLRPTMKQKYGYPYWLIHRADYQRILFDAAEAEGVDVRLGTSIERIEEEGPAVILKSGQRIQADVIVGADGIRSRVRESIIKGGQVLATDSPNCAYRATVPASKMQADPTTSHLMTDINANCWIGHQHHVMAYPIRNGELYNLVLSHPGKASVGKWNEPGDLEEMRAHYSNFDPTVRKVLEKVEGCLKWKLADLPPLPNWVSESGRVVLIGDAAHAMWPYLAQGAATSIEDGAALAECISRASSTHELSTMLRAFEAIRKPRCEAIQRGSRANGDIWHMPDGPEQQERDKAMIGLMSGLKEEVGKKNNPNQWSDDDFQPFLFGHDAIKTASLCVLWVFCAIGRTLTKKQANEYLDKISNQPVPEKVAVPEEPVAEPVQIAS